MSRLVPALAFVLAWATSALAWEDLPEFQSLTETEQAAFEGPLELSSAYFSDLLTYRVPPEWEHEWLSRSQALQIDFGSLSTTRFAMRNRLKIHQPVTDYFEVRFTWFDESHLERQSGHYVLELVLSPVRFVALSLYGEPSFRKPNDDTGVALLVRPGARHEIRLFNTFVDVTRLKYPDTSDTFVEPELPYARGIVGRAWTEGGDFVQYAFRHEGATRWRFIDDRYEYFHWKAFASLYARRRFSASWAGALRVQLDRKRESRAPTGPTTRLMGDWFTTRASALAEATAYSIGPWRDWELTSGLELDARQWTTDLGEGGFRDTLPYLKLRMPAWGPSGQDSWTLGYVLAWHRERGSPAIGIQAGDDGKVEQRLNVTYEFSLGAKGRIVLLASADLDQFATRRSWAGGSGQLYLYF